MYNDDQALLDALKRRESAAFEQMYSDFYPMVYRLVIDHQGNAGDAEDLFQEVLIILVKKIQEPGFVLSSKLSSFLFGIARNHYMAQSRKDLRLPSKPLEESVIKADRPDEADTGEKEEMEEILEMLQSKVQELNEECQQIILLSYYQNLPQTEIAVQLGYSESFVKVKKHRCMSALRELVKNNPLFKNR